MKTPRDIRGMHATACMRLRACECVRVSVCASVGVRVKTYVMKTTRSSPADTPSRALRSPLKVT